MQRRLAIAAAIGLLQGAGIAWLERQPPAATGRELAIGFAAWMALLAGPLTLQLSIDLVARRRFWLMAPALVAVLVAMAAYTGWSIFPDSAGADFATWPASGLQAFCWLAAALIWFITLPLLRGQAEPDGLPGYAAWYRAATINPFLLAQAALFTGIGWLLIELSAALFDLIGIDFIEELTEESWFVFPVLCILAGVGAQALAPDAMLWVRRHLLALLSWLLPVAAAIAVLFIAALPFTGLEPLWATRSATPLLLTLQIVLILLVNAAWQDGTGAPPFAPWLRRLLSLSLLTLPVAAALAAWSLGLRVAQHGWTVDRIWAATAVALAALLGLGYVVSLIARGERWLPRMGLVNAGVLALLALALLLFHTPLLDPKAIAVRSQVDRLLQGRIAPGSFDFAYLRFRLGRPGNAALEQLGRIEDHPQALAIRDGVAAAMRQTDPYRSSARLAIAPEALRARIVVNPVGHAIDGGFLEALAQRAATIPAEEQWQPLFACLEPGGRCRVIAIDMTADGRTDYLVESRPGGDWLVFENAGDGWVEIGFVGRPDGRLDPAAVERILETGPIEAVPSPWSDLQIGDRVYRFTPYPETGPAGYRTGAGG